MERLPAHPTWLPVSFAAVEKNRAAEVVIEADELWS
jgi:hypothetical protein